MGRLLRRDRLGRLPTAGRPGLRRPRPYARLGTLFDESSASCGVARRRLVPADGETPSIAAVIDVRRHVADGPDGERGVPGARSGTLRL